MNFHHLVYFQSENLVFRDRKLNIGPAIRKQVSLEQEAVVCFKF